MTYLLRLALLGFQGRDAGGEGCVFFACLGGHVFYRFEFFAGDDIHAGHGPFDLGFDQIVEFAANPLGGSGGVGHHFCQFIKKARIGGGHGGLAFLGKYPSLNLWAAEPLFKCGLKGAS